MVGDYRHYSVFDFLTGYILRCSEFFVCLNFVGFINFLTEVGNFRLIKFSDNLDFLLIRIFGLCQVSEPFRVSD